MAQEPLKILLIEHDASFARYVGEMLGQARELASELHVESSLEGALHRLGRTNFHVILLDLAVPDGAGLGNLPLLRGVAPQVPIIVGSDAEEDEIELEALHSGASDYLLKAQLTPVWLERSLRYATERQQLDQALLASEEKYRSLFDNLVEGIFQTTPEGRYLLANAALARIYGYDSPEQLMQNLTDIGRRLYVDQRRREEFVRLMMENDTISGFESQVYRKDGSTTWISENCRAIRDARGQLLYFEGTVEDIINRRQAEEAVKTSEALYHSLVETLPQNIFRKDLQGRFTFANQQYCKWLGKSKEEIVGKTDFDFFTEELATQYQADDRRLLESGMPYEAVEEHQAIRGRKKFVQVVKTPLYDAEGKPLGIQGIFWDITEQRIADDKIRQVNAQLTQSRKELAAKNQQMEEDLRMAREIQLTMLPQQYPPFARDGTGAGGAFQFTHRYLPTGSVGGDFFSISALSDTEAAVFVCDVAGHGVRSALVTAMIRALVEELKPLAKEPAEFLTKLNGDLYAILKHTGTPMLTTAFYLVADWQKGRMVYTNAGHPKPLHVRRSAGIVETLSTRGDKPQPVLGLFEDARYRAIEVPIIPGDFIMLFTDGLYEVQNPKEELYTQEMLLKGVERRMQSPASRIFDEILLEIRQFSADVGFDDDVCLVGMELTEPNPPNSAV